LIQDLPQTKLVATHDLDLALETCGQTILLERGLVIKSGASAEILRDQVLLETHGLELPLSLQ